MTISTINKRNDFRFGYEPYVYEDDDWIRNPSWLTMPSVDYNEQKIVKLIAVDPGSSNVAFSFRPDISNQEIIVDWGDGNVETFGPTVANVTFHCEHVYDHSNPLLDDTDRPATITSSVITRNNHGYPDGYKLFLNDISGPANIYDYKEYHVVNSTTNTFQISETSGGSPITIDADGTFNLLPYKQAILTVTGGLITFYYPYKSTNVQFSGANTSFAYDLNYLECIYSLPGCVNFSSFNRGATQHQSYNSASRMEQCSIINGGSAYFNYTFAGCRSLRSVPVFDIGDRTDRLYSTFQGCFKLQHLPDELNTANVENWLYTFGQCYSLKKLPKMDLSHVGRMDYAFADCYSLKEFPDYDLSSLTNANGMFSGCTNLEWVHSKFPNLTLSTNMFVNCNSLVQMPDIDFSQIVTAYGMFQNCHRMVANDGRYTVRITAPKLKDIQNSFYYCASIEQLDIVAPNLETVRQAFGYMGSLKSVKLELNKGCQDLLNLFYDCDALQDLSDFKIDPSVKPYNIRGMFYECRALSTIPEFDCSEVMDAQNAFGNCISLVEIPLDFSSGKLQNSIAMFNGCYSLIKIPPINHTNLRSCSSMYTHCALVKNWPAVIDLSNVLQYNALYQFFYGCFGMDIAPKLILNSNITQAYQTFHSCYNLKFLPKIENFGSITDIRSMFYVCESLREIPELDFSGVTTLDNNSFINTWNINKFKATGLGTSTLSSNLYMPYGNMSADELDNMYTNLADISSQTSRSITINNHPGRDADDPTIATAKGWTVVG